MKLKATIVSGFDELYAMLKSRTARIITERNPSQKQLEYIATKLDWAGILLATNATIGLLKDTWVNVVLFAVFMPMCVILLLVVLVLKGLEND